MVFNTSQPESTLKKKSNSICYHLVRESVAMGESLTSHISTHDNLSDILTKVTFGAKRRKLVSGVLYDIYDHEWLTHCLIIQTSSAQWIGLILRGLTNYAREEGVSVTDEGQTPDSERYHSYDRMTHRLRCPHVLIAQRIRTLNHHDGWFIIWNRCKTAHRNTR